MLQEKGRSITPLTIVGPNAEEQIVGSFGARFCASTTTITLEKFFGIAPENTLVDVGDSVDAGCGPDGRPRDRFDSGWAHGINRAMSARSSAPRSAHRLSGVACSVCVCPGVLD